MHSGQVPAVGADHGCTTRGGDALQCLTWHDSPLGACAIAGTCHPTHDLARALHAV